MAFPHYLIGERWVNNPMRMAVSRSRPIRRGMVSTRFVCAVIAVMPGEKATKRKIGNFDFFSAFFIVLSELTSDKLFSVLVVIRSI